MEKMNISNAKQVKPLGWLRRQLEIQANGLSGNLDKIWPDIRDSAWIGGTKEGWERVPYWLDGFIPLAYLLDDDDLKNRAKKYIDAILSFQKSDGWICPCDESEIKKYDSWAVLLISKVLTVYYECSGDERIPEVLYRVMKNFYDLLRRKKIKLFAWGKYRFFEGFFAINFLYERYNEQWLVELAALLKKQGADYSRSAWRWKKAKNKWRYDTHVVNVAMMLKEEAVISDILKTKISGRADRLFEKLNKYNSTPVGTFTGDECLSGLSPIQGTELCSVAELMFSYEVLYACTGNSKWAQLLELAAFNAFPATVSDDMCTHQYDQMSNQIACLDMGKKPIFRTNNGQSHLFGLEPNFGCCTANFNQAFPKLALSAFMYKDDTVLNAVPIPCEFKKDGISITLETQYPFENHFHYHIETDKAFNFKVRIESFAKNLSVNGVHKENTGMETFEISAGSVSDIDISFETEPQIVDRPNKLKSVQCGSLVFCVPIRYEKRKIEYTKDGVERKYPYCDYEYVPKSQWQYALADDELKFEQRTLSDIPFSSENPPVIIKAKLQKINWGYEKGYETVCAKVPVSTQPCSEATEIDLYPYGCSKLRITELPFVSEK